MSKKELKKVVEQDYQYGFTTDIESETLPLGLSEEVIRIISRKKKMNQNLCSSGDLKPIDIG